MGRIRVQIKGRWKNWGIETFKYKAMGRQKNRGKNVRESVIIRDLGFNPRLHQKLIGILVWW